MPLAAGTCRTCRDVVVVDNFYRDPEAVADLARGASYVPREAYPNPRNALRQSRQDFYSEGLVAAFEHVLGTKIEVAPERHTFGTFQVADASDNDRRQVHIDQAVWSAFVYLSQGHDGAPGTRLYQHKPTGDYHAREWTDEARDQLGRQTDWSEWNPWCQVAYRFNRLVLFKSDYFHAPAEYFGVSEDDARIIQLFFFDTADEKLAGHS